MSSRYPVLQPRFDALLQKQIRDGKWSKAGVDAARKAAQPVVYDLLKERCVAGGREDARAGGCAGKRAVLSVLQCLVITPLTATVVAIAMS